MWTGRKTLSSIDASVDELRDELTALDQNILRANEDLIARRREHAEHIKQLARVRADLLDDNQVAEGIDYNQGRRVNTFTRSSTDSLSM